MERESRRWVGSDGSTRSERGENDERLIPIPRSSAVAGCTGTVLLILGLTGLALFSPSEIESTEDRFSERPDSSDKETQ